MHTEKTPVKKFRQILLLLLAIILFISAFMGITYHVLSKEAGEVVISYISELAEHDMKNIRDFISDHWENLKDIKMELQRRHFQTSQDVEAELTIKSYVNEFDRIYLMDEENRLYSNTFSACPPEENPFLDVLKEDKTWVAMRYDNQDASSELRGEYMLYSYSFKNNPITLEDGTRFVRMVALNNLSEIRDRMRITSFNNRGYLSVIDGEGRYVVTNSRSSANQYHSFFDLLEGADIEGLTIEEIRANVPTVYPMNFWYTNTEGVRKFVSIMPIEGSDWSFITALEESVFTDQTSQFLTIVFWIVLLLLLIIVLILVLVYRAMRKLKRFYDSIVPGIYNRQYYDDKLEHAVVNAVAIVDLDHLKAINDNYGHLAGDQAIIRAARVLCQCADQTATVCRFGGDEFVMVFQEPVSETEFTRILNDTLWSMRRSRLEQYPSVKLTWSIGAYYGAGPANEILRQADQLLYQAKKDRDCLVSNLEEPR